MPAELQAMVDSVRRTPANNTKKLVAALEPLGQYGLDPTQRAIVGFGRFPVAGPTNWSDDWWYPRFGPGWRLHQGLDMFAAYGTPVRAPVDGTVRIHDGGLGGLSVYVTQPDRTYWYMAHLSGVAEGLAEGATVRTGQVVGYVGDSGNARGGAPHLHFEIHPRGGPAIPPKPVVDKFVVDALGLVPRLLQLYAQSPQQGPPADAPVLAAPEPVIDTLSPRQAVLWAAAANPAGGTIRLIEEDARLAASQIDWAALERRAAREQAAERSAWALLRPLTHPALARLLEP
jgi:murein DD-endopeptidase MepM/ murein hydrolase activator NlpD